MGVEQQTKEIIFLEPVFKSMIWGGEKLKTEFGYEIPSDIASSNTIGECWAVCAHPNGMSYVKNGVYEGKTLKQLWDEYRALFEDTSLKSCDAVSREEPFPLLVKLIDAKEDLSIQVHPDNGYAKKYEQGALGKTECWYIADCEENATIVIGHHARTKEELMEMIHHNRWDELICERPIKKGDFFQIEPGTVHAIRQGTLVLEIQQNSDITYRLYDYNRKKNGRLRELHIEKSIEVMTIPEEENMPIPVTGYQSGASTVKQLVKCPFYTVYKMEIADTPLVLDEALTERPFMIVSVIEGMGFIDNIPIQKGDHFIVPHGYLGRTITGALEMIGATL